MTGRQGHRPLHTLALAWNSQKLNHKHYPQIRNNKIEQVEKRVVLTYQKPDEKK